MSGRESFKFCDDLNTYLKNRYRYQRDHARINRLGDIIDVGSVKKVRLYLRFKPQCYSFWPADTLVIARIGFQNKRVRNGQDFLRFLAENSSNWGIKNIGIEEANSDCSAFARNHGFVSISERQNWCISIDNIQNLLCKS